MIGTYLDLTVVSLLLSAFQNSSRAVLHPFKISLICLITVLGHSAQLCRDEYRYFHMSDIYSNSLENALDMNCTSKLVAEFPLNPLRSQTINELLWDHFVPCWNRDKAYLYHENSKPAPVSVQGRLKIQERHLCQWLNIMMDLAIAYW